MKQQISKIITNPVVFHNRSLTIEGVCRTACAIPFPHFTIEDKTGTLICATENELPRIGQHIEVTGEVVIDTPPTRSFQVPRLNENRRQYIGQRENCMYVGCEFEAVKVAA